MVSNSSRASSLPYPSSNGFPPLTSSPHVVPIDPEVHSVSNHGSYRIHSGATDQNHSLMSATRIFSTNSRYSNTAAAEHRLHSGSNNSQVVTIDQASSQSKAETELGVDFLSIPLDDSSRRTTIFIGRLPETRQARIPGSYNLTPRQPTTDHSTKEVSRSERGAEMHHPVNKDDYLLARGANPRTGVITPGSHSASSSIDQQDARRDRVAPLPNRWRQKGDQWVSLDHGEPSPTTTPPVGESQQKSHPRSQILGYKSDEMRWSPGDYQTTYSQPVQLSHPRSDESAATFHLRSTAEGIGMFPDISEIPNEHPEQHMGRNTGPKVRRKPVGSSPANRSIDESYRAQKDSGGSTGTVVRKLHFSNDIRSSSAPEPPKVRNFTPSDLGKDLPSLPQERPSSEYLSESKELSPGPFLGQRATNLHPEIPSSKTSSTSGQPPVEKDLPCLPMNNGQSWLIQEVNQSTSRPQREVHNPVMNQLLPERQKLRGPRGGDPAYPFVRTTRQVRHPFGDQPQLQARPVGGRDMPIPIYDNPPTQAAPLAVIAEPGTRGQKPTPAGNPNMRAPVQRIDPFSQLFNTTTTHINTPMGRKQPLPGAIRSTPRPGHRMMNHERLGSLPAHPLARPHDISMNTGTSTDSMMSIPMQRTRPRAMTRPQMPMRGDGTFGIPQVGPTYYQQYSTDQAFPIEQDLGRTDSQMWTAAYQEEARLIPQPLKPRVMTSHGKASAQNPQSVAAKETPSNGLGLTRKCSRCQHGLVDISLDTDGTIHTYDLQNKNRSDSKEYESKLLHPTGRGLPKVPEEKSNMTDVEQSSGSILVHDERDHSICCPDCCKEQDCHEGCLGHPSPHSTPNTSPTKSIWSEADCPSSSSEIEDSENENDKDSLTSEKFAAGRLAFVKSAFKRSPGPVHLKPNNASPSCPDTNSSIMSSPVESSPSVGSPTESSNARFVGSGTAGLNAAMSAAGSPRRKIPSPTLQKRQRSSSSPMIGAEEFSPHTSMSHSQRSTSGPRLRVPAPHGLAIACSGTTKTRNVSGSSISTLELQVPGLGSLGLGVVGEMVIVPFEASRMWLRNHPQVMKLGWEAVERAWQMSQVIAMTAWKLWALIFVYSKTGKFKLNVAKKENMGGFLLDCARSAVYLLIFIAVGVFAMRVLNVFIVALGLIGWLFKGLFWITRQVLGFGLLR